MACYKIFACIGGIESRDSAHLRQSSWRDETPAHPICQRPIEGHNQVHGVYMWCAPRDYNQTVSPRQPRSRLSISLSAPRNGIQCQRTKTQKIFKHSCPDNLTRKTIALVCVTSPMWLGDNLHLTALAPCNHKETSCFTSSMPQMMDFEERFPGHWTPI